MKSKDLKCCGNCKYFMQNFGEIKNICSVDKDFSVFECANSANCCSKWAFDAYLREDRFFNHKEMINEVSTVVTIKGCINL